MEKFVYFLQKGLNFQNSGVGVINNYGYNMAKHGIVALTRGFKFSEPKVYDTEGIKCFALAPWFADTALVHSWVESANEKPGSWTYEGKSLTSIDDIKKAGQMRILTVHEVGQGLIKALEYDNVIAKEFLARNMQYLADFSLFQS